MESAVERPQKSSARRSRTQNGARLYGATARSRSYLINAVVGRVAPGARSRGLEKDWLSLKIGRLGARGATRPTIYEMASTLTLTLNLNPSLSPTLQNSGEIGMTSLRESESKFKIRIKIKIKITSRSQRKNVGADKVDCSQFIGSGVGSPPHPGSGIP